MNGYLAKSQGSVLKLNEFIETEHFKLEDLKIACKLVSQNCFMGKLNFKDAYYMIPIDRKYKKYLRFVFEGCLSMV